MHCNGYKKMIKLFVQVLFVVKLYVSEYLGHWLLIQAPLFLLTGSVGYILLTF